MENVELYHHGILGQKWGRRQGPPYPIPDSNHSESEKKNNWKRSLHNKNYKQLNSDVEGLASLLRAKGYNNKSLSDSELQSALEKGIDIKGGKILKGSLATRVTSEDETLDDRRKYVSVLKGDSETYVEIADDLTKNYDPDKPNKVDTYKFSKDVKVAGSKEVFDYLVKEYGDTKVKDFYKSNITSDDLRNLADFVDHRTFNNQRAQETAKYVSDGKDMLRNLANENLFRDTKTSSKTYDHFSKQGYDAILDIEDYIQGFTNYPLIILNPSNSMEKVDSKTTFDWWKTRNQ